MGIPQKSKMSEPTYLVIDIEKLDALKADYQKTDVPKEVKNLALDVIDAVIKRGELKSIQQIK
jgi:hypothetical protein